MIMIVISLSFFPPPSPQASIVIVIVKTVEIAEGEITKMMKIVKMMKVVEMEVQKKMTRNQCLLLKNHLSGPRSHDQHGPSASSV